MLTASLAGSLPLFVGGFLALFAFSGIGNGSTYKMIPAIFAAKAARHGAERGPRPTAAMPAPSRA